MLPSTRKRFTARLLRMRLNPCLELWPEVSDQSLNRPCKSLAKSADRVALDLLRKFLHHVDLPRTCSTLLEARHDLLCPLGALTARCALSARFVVVEFRQA